VISPIDRRSSGTPAGVGPVARGDLLEGRVDGFEPLVVKVT
jgi:fumarylpyruvate hydrolase